MSNEWKSILGIGTIILLMMAAFAVFIVWDKKKKRRRMLERIRRDWGAWPARQYDSGDWDAAAGYYVNKQTGEFQIDDTTWEDLGMDRVFMLLNHTGSFLGEGYLYYLLRTPSFDEKELLERDRLINYFAENPEEREQAELFFYSVGKTGRASVFDSVYDLARFQPGSKWPHFLNLMLFAASLAVLFVAPAPGILLILGWMAYGMQDYYRRKRPVEKYVTSTRFLLKTLEIARELGKLELPPLKEYQKRIREAADHFGKLKRNTFFLMMGSRTDADLLAGIIMYLNSCFHIDLLQFFTVVKEMKLHLKEFEVMVEELGKLEAAIAVASFRACMKDWCRPKLLNGEEVWNPAGSPEKSANGTEQFFGPLFLDAENVYHPLIQDPVKNSIRAERGVLLTGSNASGKSTFLKTVAVNAILSQTVYTCMADHWSSDYFRVYSSMALQDNLEGQESYYIVEIKSLKRILDETLPREEEKKGKPAPVLCFVDEVLRGTNTVERIAASSQILKYMAGRQALCFAATHDIELTHILENYYDNYHFQEQVQDHDIQFDYKLYSGRAVSRNAIKLLGLMGYEGDVIQAAERSAEQFLETGEWGKQA